MKHAATVLLLLLARLHVITAADVTPIAKVLQLLTDVHAKIVSQGEEAEKTYNSFAKFCDSRSFKLKKDIEVGGEEKIELEAAISKDKALISSLSTKVEELSASMTTDEGDLKAATEIRKQEALDFAAEESNLTETVSILDRAITILEREMRKGGASALQLSRSSSLAQALGVLVDASALSVVDGQRLTALVQSQRSDDEDAAYGAPAAEAYESHSGDIIETLENLLDKAQTQLTAARKKETAAINNFQMLKQSLQDEIKFASKDMDEAKKGIAESSQRKATAEGELDVTTKDLNMDTESLEDLNRDCLNKAQDHQADVASRAEEIKAITAAKAAIEEKFGGAAGTSTPSQPSFFQMMSDSGSKISSGADLANFEAVRFVRDLARKEHSAQLAQLAYRMAATIREGTSHGEDPFAKVKGLIREMLDSLKKDQDDEASHKAYCDEETAEAKQKKYEKEAMVDKLGTQIDQQTARSARLKQEVADLQKSISELVSAQAEMDRLRTAEKEDFKKTKAELQQGLEGCKISLKVLREYYSSDKGAGAVGEGESSGILALLETVDTDMAKSLAEAETSEENAQAEYDKETAENKAEKMYKEKDVDYKAKEVTRLDKDIADAVSDKAGVQAELDAVLQALRSLAEQCIAKPETYSARKARREAELAGLKEALSILDGESVLLQQQDRRSLRGVQPHW